MGEEKSSKEEGRSEVRRTIMRGVEKEEREDEKEEKEGRRSKSNRNSREKEGEQEKA